jgi:hypothetical protein
MKKITSMLLGLIVCGCVSSSSIDNKIFETIDSPNKSSKAIVFERNVGATTGFNRQVAIIESSKAFGKHDNTEGFFCITGEAKVEVIWLSETNILLRYPLWQQVIRTNSQAGRVSISYETH